jgi:hypothetical protein
VPHAISSPAPGFSTPQRFFRRFEQERMALLSAISGLSANDDSSHYASLLLRRLMVLYFLQAHGFLDHNPRYLPQQLLLTRTTCGPDAFFHTSLLPLFSTLASSTSHVQSIPALDLPLFALCTYEQEMARQSLSVTIPDVAFERLFAFFATFQWSLAPPANPPAHLLGPAILASLFEQQINQKQMGAYYTHADVTLYVATNTLIPSLFASLAQHFPDFFAPDGLLLSLLQKAPERYIHAALNAPGRLPLETERDLQGRRARYTQLLVCLQQGRIASIAEMVNANLDLQRLLFDLIETTCDPGMVLQIYHLLSQTTILDPTCGSGAFLLAALALLQPLYTACLTRLTTLIQEKSVFLSADQQRVIEQVLSSLAAAPNQTFFVVEQSIMRNLYGVDIMDEAVEICQLCLFLTLLASVEDGEDLPSFSRLSLHIRAGNALVGFVDAPDAVFHADGYPSLQDGSTLAVQRQRLDYLLAHKNGAMGSFADASGGDLDLLTQWRELHRPFHWCLEFPECIQQGGFSVIIGNPPFIEYRKAEYGTLFSDYQTQRGGNLYALVMERALQLCRRDESFLGLLVPLSLCNADRFAALRHLLMSRMTHLWLANFAIFPCRLFEGSFQRLSLVFAHNTHGQARQLATTRIQRWYTAERPSLLTLIAYTPVTLLSTGTFPKLAAPFQERILVKVAARTQGGTLANLLSPASTPHFVYYQEATNYWTKASCVVPFYKKNGTVTRPAHGRTLYFAKQELALAMMAVMNSSLFYVWFATYADGFHLTHGLVTSFPIAYEAATFERLALLAQRLHDDIQCHAQRSTRNTRTRHSTQAAHQIELEEFHMGRSKSLLNDIDGILAQYYGFTSEELDFIVNYDEKYRIGERGD